MDDARELAPFPCNGCGKCCRLVDRNAETAWLDRGDGTCRHFDEASHGCAMYATRPLVCRVQDYYVQRLAQQLTWSEFVRIDLEICARL